MDVSFELFKIVAYSADASREISWFVLIVMAAEHHWVFITADLLPTKQFKEFAFENAS